MSVRPSNGIGGRLARYRRLTGLSARELAEQAGMGLTRAVIANIESGRKTDISVDQLIAISSVLCVPPVVLAVPVDEPYRFVRATDSEDQFHAMRAFAMMDWFQGVQSWFPQKRVDGLDTTDATTIALEIVRVAREYVDVTHQLSRHRSTHPHLVEEDTAEREALLTRMRSLMVDPTYFEIDDDG